MKISKSLIAAFFIFPFNVMGTVPALILWLSRDVLLFSAARSLLGGVAVAAGLAVIYHTVSLFTEYGDGTPAPFDPPKKFVARGLYRYVRNPMMIGVVLVLTGEAVVFGSCPLLGWGLFFMAASLIYIPFFEEPELARRFGGAYAEYLGNVPRWFPRFAPWDPKQDKS
ncbi:MAG: isoprenylcysteine carboxylmethyltransferase family protein [Nitrospinae bacterium]|nr:isoprenylcysteine carboxylmethyltransferase family protein [Nitrospinota bacterium]